MKKGKNGYKLIIAKRAGFEGMIFVKWNGYGHFCNIKYGMEIKKFPNKKVTNTRKNCAKLYQIGTQLKNNKFVSIRKF